jgi:hypothetical protein
MEEIKIDSDVKFRVGGAAMLAIEGRNHKKAMNGNK